MGEGIILIVGGLICIFLPKTPRYKDYLEKHNHTEDFLSFIRNIVAGVFIVVGIIVFLLDL